MRPVGVISRYRRSSFWNTLERYLIFSWICEGVRSSRKRAETSYCQRTGGDFWQMQTQARPASVKNSAPEVKTPRPEAKNTGTGATRSVKPKRAERPSAAQKASVAQSGAKSVSVPTVLGQNVSEADAEKQLNGQYKRAGTVKKPNMNGNRTAAETGNSAHCNAKQICAIHADVELSANSQNDSGGGGKACPVVQAIGIAELLAEQTTTGKPLRMCFCNLILSETNLRHVIPWSRCRIAARYAGRKTLVRMTVKWQDGRGTASSGTSRILY